MRWSTQPSFQLLQGKLLLAGPRCRDREKLKDEAAVDDIFFHRHERDRSAAFVQGLGLSAQEQRRLSRGRGRSVGP